MPQGSVGTFNRQMWVSVVRRLIVRLRGRIDTAHADGTPALPGMWTLFAKQLPLLNWCSFPRQTCDFRPALHEAVVGPGFFGAILALTNRV